MFAIPSLTPLAHAAPWHHWPPPVPRLLAVSPDGLVAGTEAAYPADGRAIRLWSLGFQTSGPPAAR